MLKTTGQGLYDAVDEHTELGKAYDNELHPDFDVNMELVRRGAVERPPALSRRMENVRGADASARF